LVKSKTDPKIEDNIILTMSATKYPKQASIFDCLPTPDFRLSDAAITAMVWTRMGFLPESVATACPIAEDTTRMRHFVNCSTCRQGTIRHNTVLYAFTATLPKIGIAVTVNPHDFPLPKNEDDVHNNQSSVWAEKSTEGPDAQIHTDGTCIDLTICSPFADWAYKKGSKVIATRDCLVRGDSRKRTLYNEWSEVYDLKLEPMAMSTTGFLSTQSLAYLESLARDRARWYTRWASLKMQKALCEAHAMIYRRAMCRSIGQQYISKTVNPRTAKPTTQTTPSPTADSDTASSSP
jgi:hypothetical protein